MTRRREGTWPKLARAKELLAIIEAELAFYRESDIYDAVAEYDDSAVCYVIWPKVAELPPLRLPVLVGECAYNIRSALDHLAHALVIDSGGTPTPRTQFPIRESDRDSEGKVTPTFVDGGIRASTLAVIDSYQPYNRRDQPSFHPLALLARINNIDKHRNLLLATVAWADGLIQLVSEGRVVNYTQVTGHFDNSTPLCYFAGPRLQGELIVNGICMTDVIFNEVESPGRQPVMETLQRILGHVSDHVVPEVAGDAGLTL